MILKALDLLRELGWGIISLIYNFIDAIYSIISKINELDIVGTMAENKTFSSFYSSVVVISLTIFGLFVTWQFAKKIIEPDEGPSVNQIVTEVFKCGALILVSTFLFVQISTFSIQLSGYTGSILTNGNNTTLGTELLSNYVDYADDYKSSDKFENDDFKSQIKNGTFSSQQHYNDKYTIKERFIRSDERDYKYKIQWIVAVLCGGFFLYALVFSAIMLARRQVEFLFLFLISPIIYATSVCNKQRRSALVEQLVSLTLQSAVVVLIINITALLAVQINATSFFSNYFQNMATKSLLYLGCATFLLTGSKTINRFIGSNVSANSGREQLMSLMGFGKLASGAGKMVGAKALGAGVISAGATLKGGNYLAKKTGIAGKVGNKANNILQRAGMGMATFGSSFASPVLPDGSTMSSSNPFTRAVQGVGNSIRSHGLNMATSADKRNSTYQGIGLNKKIASGTSSMMRMGLNMVNPLNRMPIPRHTGTNPYLHKKEKI